MSAQTIDELAVGDDAEAWRAAGFDVDPDGVAAVGTVRVRLAGRDDGKRIQRWSLRGADVRGGDIDGIATDVSDRALAAPGEHPNGVLSIDHVVLATPDVPRTVAAIEAAGIRALRTRETDSYGAPMVQTFFRLGEVVLELIGPSEPAGDGPAGFFGLAFTVADLDATAASYGAHMGGVKDAVQPGRRIATLRHKELDITVACAFMSPEPQPEA